MRAKQIGERDGCFSVTWDPATRSLTWEDNGIGMDAATIQAKFLSLGDSGKRDASGSAEAAGGFGVAKAVILGVSPTFQWELHTRDNLAHPEEGGAVPIDDAPLRQGTRITVFDIDRDFDSQFDYARSEYVSLVDRLRLVLGACDLPGLTLVFNGQPVDPFFSRRGGSRVQAGSFGPDTTATVKLYRRSDRGGAYWLRLGGLYQFHAPARRGRLPADVVIDLTTTLRPGERGYPLTASRTSLQGPAQSALADLQREVEKESESAGRSEEYETYDPEQGPDSATAAEVQEGFAAALADVDLQAGLAAGARTLQQFAAADAQSAGVPMPIDSTAPQGSRTELPERIRVAVAALEAGAGSAQDLQLALADLGDHAMAPGGEGLAQLVPAMAAVQRALSAAPTAPPLRNPFGRYAGLRISKRNYDRAKARAFKKAFARWVPYLVAWDLVLRLVARVGRIQDRFLPGFVLDDSVSGLAAKATTGSTSVVYIHPDQFKATAREFAAQPAALAYYLHALACHELAHVELGLGDGHGEEFVSHRETLGKATSGLLPAIEAGVVRILKLSPTASPEAQALRACEKKLVRVNAQRSGRSAAQVERAAAEARVARVEAALRALPAEDETRAELLPLIQEDRRGVVNQLIRWRREPK